MTPGGSPTLGIGGAGGRVPAVVSDCQHEIAPFVLLRSLVQECPNAVEYPGELAVVERPDQDHAGVRSLRLGPFPCEWREVAAVARDQHALLGGCEFEDGWVGEPLEAHVRGQREHVMTGVCERGADPLRREVRVEQQPHGRLLDELHERVELAPRVDRAAVLRNRFGDLVRVAVAIRERERDLPLAELRVGDQSGG